MKPVAQWLSARMFSSGSGWHRSLSDRRWLLLLLALALAHGLIYMAVIPPWQAPDEMGHFEYAWTIAALGRLPGPKDADPRFEQELLASLYEWRYGQLAGRVMPERMPASIDDLPASARVQQGRTLLGPRFSLAYVWQALFIRPLRSQDLVFQLLAARFSSVVLNLIVVLLAFLTLEQWFSGNHSLVIVATAVLVLWPQHTFINSAVGEGPLAEMLSCLVLYGWTLLFVRGFRLWPCLGIVLGCLAGLWTKNTAAFLVPMNAFLALWWLWRFGRGRWSWRHIGLLVMGVALLAVAIWAWLQSPLGARVLFQMRNRLAPQDWAWYDQRGGSLGEALLASYDSFWAHFGWMTLPLGPRWYGAIAALSTLAIWGWLRSGGWKPASWTAAIAAGSLGLAVAIFGWTALLSKQSGYYQTQGRYLFPVAIPYLFALVGGLGRVLPIASRSGRVWLVGFLLALDTWSLAWYILAYFYA
jgi:hypothetical protein